MAHRAGYVNIVGPPNVGKSTLLNALLGEKLVITNPKAQTTRHRILGILNGDDHQIVFSDTPGVIEPRYEMQRRMMRAVEESFRDADVLLVMTDTQHPPDALPSLVEKAARAQVPVAVLVNKFDLAGQEAMENMLLTWQEALPKAKVVPLSALHGFHVQELREWLVRQLPEHPPYFPKDQLSDRHMRFFVAEIIRDKILGLYSDEIPYSAEVVVTSFQEEPEITRIEADIIVMREGQKAILIGHEGKALRRLGTSSRKAIEDFLDCKVFLRFNIRVEEGWREDADKLRQFGYT